MTEQAVETMSGIEKICTKVNSYYFDNVTFVTFLIAALTTLTACLPTTQPSLTPITTSNKTIRTITIFTTSDEHGYLEPISDRSNTYGGTANLLTALRQRGHDPAGDDTGIQWREPVIEWIIAQETSPERPLETLLDSTERGPGR